MEPSSSSSPKFLLSHSLINRYRNCNRKLVTKLDELEASYIETGLVIYKNAKQILQAVIGKLEIVISYGPCEFEWMDEVHNAILSFNEASDNYEDIMHEIREL